VPILILSNQNVIPSFQWFPRWITGNACGVKGSRDGNEFEKNHFKDNVAKFCTYAIGYRGSLHAGAAPRLNLHSLEDVQR
jgi:hypothetical protein